VSNIIIGEKYQHNTYINKIKNIFKKKEECYLEESDFLGNVLISGCGGVGKTHFLFNIIEKRIGLDNQVLLMDNMYEANYYMYNMNENLKKNITLVKYSKNINIENLLKKINNKKGTLMIIFNTEKLSYQYNISADIYFLIDEIMNNKNKELLKLFILKENSEINRIEKKLKDRLKISRKYNLSIIVSNFDILEIDFFKTKIIFKVYDVLSNKIKINIRDLMALNAGEFYLVKNFNNNNTRINKMICREMKHPDKDFDINKHMLINKINNF
jgi:hypothetical protein